MGLTPQVWSPPALTETNCPSGGEARPARSSPQQVTEASGLTPQVWFPPALTEVNCPPGGVASPSSSLPPAGDGAVKSYSAGVSSTGADEANLPSGGVASPSSSLPQQATVPSVFTPQVCLTPALTEANSSPRGSVGSLPPTHAATIAIISSIARSRHAGRAGNINLQRVSLAPILSVMGKPRVKSRTRTTSLIGTFILLCHTCLVVPTICPMCDLNESEVDPSSVPELKKSRVKMPMLSHRHSMERLRWWRTFQP